MCQLKLMGSTSTTFCFAVRSDAVNMQAYLNLERFLLYSIEYLLFYDRLFSSVITKSNNCTPCGNAPVIAKPIPALVPGIFWFMLIT